MRTLQKTRWTMLSHPHGIDRSERICPAMSNDDFHIAMSVLRERAVKITQRRLHDLNVRDSASSARVKEWFGRDDELTRKNIASGLVKLIAALKTLTSANFVRYTPDFGAAQGCAPNSPSGQAAAVCQSDVKNKIIAFTRLYCDLLDISAGKDSKLSVLIHEVAHFDDVLNARYHAYGVRKSKALAIVHPEAAIENSDNYAGYVCERMIFSD